MSYKSVSEVLEIFILQLAQNTSNFLSLYRIKVPKRLLHSIFDDYSHMRSIARNYPFVDS